MENHQVDTDNCLRAFTARHSPANVTDKQRENSAFLQKGYHCAWSSFDIDPQLKVLIEKLAEESLESMDDLQNRLQMLDRQQQAGEGGINGQSDK